MKTKLILIIILITTFNVGAQQRAVPFKNGVFNNNFENFALIKMENKYNGENSKKAHGTYYLEKEWKKCSIEGIDGKKYVFDECNYNIFDKRMELAFEEDVIILKEGAIKQIKIKDSTFKPLEVSSDNNNKYYQELFKNENISLIKLYKLKKKSVPSSSSLGLFDQKVEVNSKKYFLIDGSLIKVPNSKSKILKLLGKEKEKNKYKDYNVKNDADLIKLLKNI